MLTEIRETGWFSGKVCTAVFFTDNIDLYENIVSHEISLLNGNIWSKKKIKKYQHSLLTSANVSAIVHIEQRKRKQKEERVEKVTTGSCF